jgi:ribose transport system ATP-binding protein
VHQELSLVPELTVAENILLGRFPLRRSRPRIFIDWSRTFQESGEILTQLGARVDVRQRAADLGVAQQQIVEIAKAMSYNPSVLLLDEPTSALAHRETEALFTLLRGLASRGVVLVYITHRLEEIHRIADTVTVLRDGVVAGSFPAGTATPGVIARHMFGGTVQRHRPPGLRVSRDPVMELRAFSRSPVFANISFSLYTGEVLGIAGVLGSGRTELLRAIFGADPHDAGDVILGGVPVTPRSPKQMKRLGVALAPEKRKEEGLVQLLSTGTNVCLASLRTVSRMGFITRAREADVASRYVRDLDIVTPGLDSPVSSLSGGNQQKVVIAKWLNTAPRVILFDEPTRGVDVEAKQHLFQVFWDLSRRGISSIVVSSELEELFDVCHRILVMKRGCITEEILPHESTVEHLLSVCMQ